jgi:hypothetical protein
MDSYIIDKETKRGVHVSVQVEEPLPMPYTHALSVYEEMRKGAKLMKDDQKRDILVWEGFMTHLFDGLGLATPTYTSILGHLKRMGCINQLRRGGSTTKSLWELCAKPTEDLFRDSVARSKPTTKTAQLEQQVAQLNQRLTSIENALRSGGVALS